MFCGDAYLLNRSLMAETLILGFDKTRLEQKPQTRRKA